MLQKKRWRGVRLTTVHLYARNKHIWDLEPDCVPVERSWGRVERLWGRGDWVFEWRELWGRSVLTWKSTTSCSRYSCKISSVIHPDSLFANIIPFHSSQARSIHSLAGNSLYPPKMISGRNGCPAIEQPVNIVRCHEGSFIPMWIGSWSTIINPFAYNVDQSMLATAPCKLLWSSAFVKMQQTPRF